MNHTNSADDSRVAHIAWTGFNVKLAAVVQECVGCGDLVLSQLKVMLAVMLIVRYVGALGSHDNRR